MTKLYISICTVLAFTLIGCSNDSGGDGLARVLVQFEVASGNSNKTLLDNFVVDAGAVQISEIVFDGDREVAVDSVSSVSISHEQIVTVDLMTQSTTPQLQEILIPAGVYRSVDLGIEIFDDVDDPSVVIDATYTSPTGVITPVRFEFNSGEVFEAEASTVELFDDTQALAKITFDPVDWFAPVSDEMIDGAVKNNTGVIIVSETNNEEIFDIVADRLDVATEAVFQ